MRLTYLRKLLATVHLREGQEVVPGRREDGGEQCRLGGDAGEGSSEDGEEKRGGLVKLR